jgi:glyoxylate/hydroxypyruvate reductase A
LPLARVVDNNLALQMARYVTGQILNHHLQLAQLKGQQADKVWSVPAVARQPSVLLLGAGVLAQAIASALRVLGVEVSLWARSERSDGSVLTGESALQQSLAKCDYLVNTLPLTDETYGFLNAQLFAHCRRGCYLINVARGDHLVEKDLIDALALGQLSGATLDVFSVEPLPQEHPFWHHPQIQITPHCAAITDQESVVAQVVENYRRVEQGMPLCNLVDLKLGY